MRNLLLSTVALLVVPAVAFAAPDFPSHIHTHTTPIELEPISPSSGLKLASVCFLGYGNCETKEDFTIDTAAQCRNEGFIKNNCNSVQTPEAYCSYNSSYITRCKCVPNLISCPAGQVGVGDSCNGRYASCKCDPSLVSCSSKEIGQGASCGGRYQYCVCRSEYKYTSSNCTSPRFVSGDSCGGKYTGCSCPSGVSSGAFGCSEYYPSPCTYVCKKAYDDNCRNRTAVSTPYGCAEYWSDCSSKCKTAYTDNCRNRTAVTCEYGCASYFGDCQTKCQTCGTNPDCDVTSKTCEYGCASTNSCSKCTECKGNPDCDVTTLTCQYGCANTNSCGKCTACKGNPDCDVTSKTCEYGCASTNSCGKCTACKGNPDCDVVSKTCEYGCANTNSCGKCTGCKGNPDCDVTPKTCQYGCSKSNSCGKCTECYADNCRNRTSVSAPYGCQTYWSDCKSMCQIAYTDNCRNRTAASCSYGCQSNWVDCTSKCQTCYADNCRNRTAVSVPANASCSAHYSDCASKCSAWKCNSGYVQSGNACIPEHTHSYICPSGYSATNSWGSNAVTTSKVCSCSQASGTCYRAPTCKDGGFLTTADGCPTGQIPSSNIFSYKGLSCIYQCCPYYAGTGTVKGSYTYKYSKCSYSYEVYCDTSTGGSKKVSSGSLSNCASCNKSQADCSAAYKAAIKNQVEENCQNKKGKLAC